MGEVWECEHGVHRSEPCADCFRERASAEDEAALDQAQAEIERLRAELAEARRQAMVFATRGDNWVRRFGLLSDQFSLVQRRLDEARSQVCVAWEEAAVIAEKGCPVPPDGGAPSDEERDLRRRIAADIRFQGRRQSA